MPRIIDVIHHTNVPEDEFVHRKPEEGAGDWRMGSQVIVGESQSAVFVRSGQALDVLGPGRHTLSVANLPILAGLIGLATSGRTPFTADLYFINMRNMPQVGWGTVKPIYIKTDTGLGLMMLRTHGILDMKVADPALFLSKYGMNRPVTRMRDIKDRIQTMLLGEINSLLLRSGVDSIVGANTVLEEIEGAMLVQINDKFREMGLEITAFEANPFDTANVPIEELRDLVPLEVWLEVLERQKRLDIGMAAAQNESLGGGLASAGVGLGVGSQIGSMMGQNQQSADVTAMQQQMMQQQQMMNQMMQEMMTQKGGTSQTSATSANAPQTKAEVQALLDNLDMKLASGEISEDVYSRLSQKWQSRLSEME